VVRPMRRTIFLALLAALLLPTAARAAGSDAVIKDCATDSKLDGTYSVADLRKALDHLPKDVDEYSDCSDVISTAIANQTTRKNDDGNSSGGGSTSGGSSGGGSSSNGSSTSGGSPSKHKPTATDQDFVIGASSPQDHQAVDEAAIKGGGPLQLDGHSVVPSARLASDVGRNGLPAALLAALALLCVLGLAATAPRVRRRVVAHRQP
jgi:hypothetical protein